MIGSALGAINSIVIGATGAVGVAALGVPRVVAVGAGVVVGLVSFTLNIRWQRRRYSARARAREDAATTES